MRVRPRRAARRGRRRGGGTGGRSRRSASGRASRSGSRSTARRERSVEALRARSPVLVFTPDRLGVVKGAPALRRAYFDRVLARLWPRWAPGRPSTRACSRSATTCSGASARRAPPSDALEPWDAQLARRRGGDLRRPARGFAERAGAPFAAHRRAARRRRAGEASLAYRPSGPTGGDGEPARGLGARRRRDVERAGTGVGPHLDDYRVRGGRPRRARFGSQGEQRTRAARAAARGGRPCIAETRDLRPLLLLDDVAGRARRRRRARLLAAVRERGQALVTTTDAALSVGAQADLVLRVAAGERVRGMSELPQPHRRERSRRPGRAARRASPELARSRAAGRRSPVETDGARGLADRASAPTARWSSTCASSTWAGELTLLGASHARAAARARLRPAARSCASEVGQVPRARGRAGQRARAVAARPPRSRRATCGPSRPSRARACAGDRRHAAAPRRRPPGPPDRPAC